MRGQETEVIEMEEDADGVFKEKRRIKKYEHKKIDQQKFGNQTDELFYNVGIGINVLSKILKKF
jgi:hypothetical protein